MFSIHKRNYLRTSTALWLIKSIFLSYGENSLSLKDFSISKLFYQQDFKRNIGF